MCSLHGVRIAVAGEVPRVGPAILVANHVSYLDPLLIMSVIPTLAIAKHEVGAWPILGEFARGLDLLLVDRSRAHSGARVLLRAKTLLERGVSILVFPEGTTTCGEQVLPFKRGMFGLAARLGLPVIPIALRYADTRMAWVGDASFLPHYLATTTRDRLDAELEFGAPMHAQRGEAAEQFAARVREAMHRRLCRPLRHELDVPADVHHAT
jgi:1-acyl-sn-glycerol-3-phosphate acyltransferase